MQKSVLICPSILASDFAALGQEVRDVTEAFADMIHIDVMDGHYVPNLTIGPNVIKAIKPYSSLPFDVHLMISPVDPYLEAFKEAGADIISVHPEACPHLDRTIKTIKELGAKAGLVLNPATPLSALDWVIEELDLIMVMSVNPGFGGQKFITSQLRKIETIRTRLNQLGLHQTILEVDGGVTSENAHLCINAGATALVAGSAIFKGGKETYAKNILRLRGGE